MKFVNELDRRTETKFIFLHHAAAAYASAKRVHEWHLDNGWSGIGYHKVIRSNGQVERGRPDWAVGAHVRGYNSNSIGIMLEGSYENVKVIPYAQKKAVVEELIKYKLKYPEAVIAVHRWAKTHESNTCPGIPNWLIMDICSDVEEKVVEYYREQINNSKGALQRAYAMFRRILKRRGR